MKQFFLISLLLFTTIHLNAQNSGGNSGGNKKTSKTNETPMDKDATEMANKVCDCFNKVTKDLHPKTVELMMKAAEAENEEEGQKIATELMLGLSMEDQQGVIQDMSKMQNFGETLENECGKPDDEFIKGKYDTTPELETQFGEKVLEKLQARPECKFGAAMMKAGLKKK